MATTLRTLRSAPARQRRGAPTPPRARAGDGVSVSRRNGGGSDVVVEGERARPAIPRRPAPSTATGVRIAGVTCRRVARVGEASGQEAQGGEFLPPESERNDSRWPTVFHPPSPTLTPQDFGSRAPKAGELESNFSDKVLGNWDTAHIIR